MGTHTIGHLQLTYRDFGPKDGPVLVLLHGRGSNRKQFAGAVDILGAAGHRLILIDLPGHGQSKMPTLIRKEDWTLTKLATLVHDLVVNHLEINRFNLFGHSLGGVIALEFITLYPNSVSHIITMGTHLEIQSIKPWRITLDKKLRCWLGNSGLYTLYLNHVWCQSGAERSALRAVHGRPRHNAQRDCLIINQIPSNYDYRNSLKAFIRSGGKLSTISCHDDWLINPGMTPSLLFQIQHAAKSFFDIPGGHYTHLAEPEPFAKALCKLLRR